MPHKRAHRNPEANFCSTDYKWTFRILTAFCKVWPMDVKSSKYVVMMAKVITFLVIDATLLSSCREMKKFTKSSSLWKIIERSYSATSIKSKYLNK